VGHEKDSFVSRSDIHFLQAILTEFRPVFKPPCPEDWAPRLLVSLPGVVPRLGDCFVAPRLELVWMVWVRHESEMDALSIRRQKWDLLHSQEDNVVQFLRASANVLFDVVITCARSSPVQ